MAENPPTNLATPSPASDPGQVAHCEPQPSARALVDELAGAGAWCVRNPLPCALLAAILGTLYFFFFVYHPFTDGQLSTAGWAWSAWSDDQVYDRIVPFVTLWLFWFHRHELLRSVQASSNRGLVWVLGGIGLFVVGSRCLQPRMTLLSVPLLIYGAAMYLWGKKVARGILFPCAFLIFMVPAGVFTQVTFNLQFIITALVGTIAPLFGIGIQAVGTTLTANDGSFNFQVVEGCSGIRSLVAMMMLTAIYVHLTQIRLWKKLTIFSASILFALIGNTGRILSIVLVAKYVSKTFAEGTFHEVSGYISFPFALGAMIAFDWFLGKFAETLPVPNAEPGSSPEGGAKETPLTDAAPPSSANENKRPEYDY